MPKPKLLITGAHHAREQSTVSMCVYTVLRLLYQYVQNDPETLYILNNAAIVVIPVVNVDGFQQISDNYKANGNWSYTRKNMHQYNSGCTFKYQNGVDLQRNYGFQFGLDDIGSSSDPCSDNYRGPSAFSEPETQAIRNFLSTWSNIKLAINFHAYGNYMTHPFNFNSTSTQYLESNFTNAAQFYQELIQNGAPTDTFLNSTNSSYRLNGDASDYMLYQHGIFAFSP
jgi:murein tripeptide amidase MpaA